MKSLGISALSHFEKFITLQAYYSLVGRELEREIVPVLWIRRWDCWCGVRWPADF